MTEEYPARKAFLLYVDLDPIPGIFHTDHSAYVHVQGILDNHVAYYRPIVIWVKTDASKPRKRACFAVFVNLDPIPGLFHTQESAEDIIRSLFIGRIPHYNPMVSLAPDYIQPENLLKGMIDA